MFAAVKVDTRFLDHHIVSTCCNVNGGGSRGRHRGMCLSKVKKVRLDLSVQIKTIAAPRYLSSALCSAAERD